MEIVSVRAPAVSWTPYTTATASLAGWVAPITPVTASGGAWPYVLQDYALPLFNATGALLGVATGRRLAPTGNAGLGGGPAWGCTDACALNSATRRHAIAAAAAMVPFGPANLTGVTSLALAQPILMVRRPARAFVRDPVAWPQSLYGAYKSAQDALNNDLNGVGATNGDFFSVYKYALAGTVGAPATACAFSRAVVQLPGVSHGACLHRGRSGSRVQHPRYWRVARRPAPLVRHQP